MNVPEQVPAITNVNQPSVRQTPSTNSAFPRIAPGADWGDGDLVRSTKRHPSLPIGRAARIAFEIDSARRGCCEAASALFNRTPLDEEELEECARLDEALARAQRLLKGTVRSIMLSRIQRRSRRSRAKGS